MSNPLARRRAAAILAAAPLLALLAAPARAQSCDQGSGSRTFFANDFSAWLPPDLLKAPNPAQAAGFASIHFDPAIPGNVLRLTAALGLPAPVIGGVGNWADGDHLATQHVFVGAPSATWNPAAQGAITRLTAEVEARMVSFESFLGDPSTWPTATIAGSSLNFSSGFNVGLLVKQNGHHYIARLGFVCTRPPAADQDCTHWYAMSSGFDDLGNAGRQQFLALKEPYDPAAGSPDFTAAGAPLEFGLSVSQSGGQPSSVNSYSFAYTGDVDRWTVTICTDKCVKKTLIGPRPRG